MHSFAAGLLLVYKLYFCVMFTLNWACAKSVLGMCRHNWPCLWQIWWMTMTIWYVFGWLKLRLNSGFVLKLRHRLDRVTHLMTVGRKVSVQLASNISFNWFHCAITQSDLWLSLTVDAIRIRVKIPKCHDILLITVCKSKWKFNTCALVA